MSLTASYPAVTGGGTVTSWLPVTTAWSAPAACSMLIWEGYPPYLALNDPRYGIYVDSDLTCLPAEVTTWWEQDHYNYGTTTFNLGPIVCPSAYTTATTSMQDSSTFVACCPSDYSLSTLLSAGGAGQCISPVTVGQEITLVTYTSITNSNEAASAWVTTMYTAISAEVVNGVQMNGWNFVPASTTSTSSSTSSTSTSSSSSSTATQSAPSASTTGPASSSSSSADDTGRNIGIGVGVSLGAVGILSAVFAIWFVRRRRRRQLSTDPNYHPVGQSQGVQGPMSGGYGGWEGYQQQQQQQQPLPAQFHEMQASKAYPAHELAEPAYIGELDGTQAAR